MIKTTGKIYIITSRILFGVFFLLINPQFSFSQEQQWKIDVSSHTVSAIPYAQLEVSDKEVLAVVKSYAIKVTPMGRLSRDLGLNGIGLRIQLFFEEQLEFDILGSYNLFQSSIDIVTRQKSDLEAETIGSFKLATPMNENTIPLIFPSTEEKNYFVISQDSIHNVSIFSFDNFAINYSIPHGGKDFTCYLIKDDVIYLGTNSGEIYNFYNKLIGTLYFLY